MTILSISVTRVNAHLVLDKELIYSWPGIFKDKSD